MPELALFLLRLGKGYWFEIELDERMVFQSPTKNRLKSWMVLGLADEAVPPAIPGAGEPVSQGD